MVLLVRLLPDQRCSGCAAIGYCEEKTMLCLYCFGFKVNVEIRKRKLGHTMAQRFASLRDKIRAQLHEFQSPAA
jgi:hypothetical protein